VPFDKEPLPAHDLSGQADAHWNGI